MKRSDKIKAYSGVIVIVALFFLISYLVNKNIDYLTTLLVGNRWAIIIYFVIIIAEIVLAPISLIPLIPLASALFGPTTTFIVTLAGWTLGSLLAFLLARHLGEKYLAKIVKDAEAYQRYIPEKNLFLGVIMTRIFIPIDLMSYAIALFTKIDAKRFTLATLIGFAPGTAILAYYGGVPTVAKYVLIAIGVLYIIAISVFREELVEFFRVRFKLEK